MKTDKKEKNMLTKEKKFVKIHKRKKVFKIADKRKKGNFRKEVKS